MVRTRNQKASDESSGGATLDRKNQSPLGNTAGPSCSSLTEQPARELQMEKTHESVVLMSNKGSTKMGKARQRLQWTAEMNQHVMRCYYKITELETNKTVFRKKLYEMFNQRYPDYGLTEQRVADQKRAIEIHKYITTSELEEIKEEVRGELQREKEVELVIALPCGLETGENDITTTHKSAETQLEESHPHAEGNGKGSDEDDQRPTTDSEEWRAKMGQEFETAWIQFAGMDPERRPAIPKQKVTWKLKEATKAINKYVIPERISEIHETNEFIDLVYCSAVAVSRANGANITNSEDRTGAWQRGPTKPRWQIRLERKIEDLRKDIGRLTQIQQGNTTRRLVNKVNRLLKSEAARRHSKYEENEGIKEIIDTLKQKLQVLSRRMARYRLSYNRRKDNIEFGRNEKVFYRKVKQGNLQQTEKVLSVEAVKNFWTSIWGKEEKHDETAIWIKRLEENANEKQKQKMDDNEVTIEELVRVIKKTHNWKAPGVDKVHNYWYKYFPAIHPKMVQLINEMIAKPTTQPEFLTKGITYLIPKGGNPQDPAKYRPITCLTTLYKIITACLTNKIVKYCDEQNILAEQQKGCKKFSLGCKEQLTIDGVVMKQAHKKKRNLYTAYIDYEKAYDSVPHSWLQKVLNIYKIDGKIVQYLCQTMKNWKTTLVLNSANEITRQVENIAIKRGIFQGDSLSPLWFCIALNPLSELLEKENFGYCINKATNQKCYLSHLMYMDDIKLYAKTQREMKSMLETVHKFSLDIKMRFGLDKCRTVSMIRGEQKEIEVRLQDSEEVIVEALKNGEIYKYLGMEQNKKTETQMIKTRLKQEYAQRVQAICKTKLNSRNLFKAINTFAIPVLTYSFGIIPWNDTEMEEIQRRTRTILTQYRYHHPKSAIERITIPRKQGGRGMLDIATICDTQVLSMRKYFYGKRTPNSLINAIVDADDALTPLNLRKQQMELESRIEKRNREQIEAWQSKALHGRFYHELHSKDVDTEASCRWLQVGEIYPETEGFLMAVQDQVIATNNYRKAILKESGVNDQCRKCGSRNETIAHILNGCSVLTAEKYRERHDDVAKIIHQAVLRTLMNIKIEEPYYTYKPQVITENDGYRIYWDRTIHTDKTVANNRPDIVVWDKRVRQVQLIDIAIPYAHNMQRTYYEKIRKYGELSEQIKRQWNVNRVETIPVIVSSTGLVHRELRNNLKKIGIQEGCFKKMQKAVIIKSSSLVREFLEIK